MRLGDITFTYRVIGLAKLAMALMSISLETRQTNDLPFIL